MQAARLFYAAAGPADLVSAHKNFKDGKHDPSEVSLTFSSQIEEFCADIGAVAYFLSVHPNRARYEDDTITIEHRPKRLRHGAAYHLEELRYGLGMLLTAVRWRADVAVLDSGITHFFVMSLFRLFRIAVVPVLHNTLWPAGFRPRSIGPLRIIDWLNRRFWRSGPTAVIGVSPECIRQLSIVAPTRTYQTHEVRAQFLPEYFAQISPPPAHSQRPFQVMFIGRVDAIKGVLDIPAMARRIEDKQPGLVHWVVCGRGRNQDDLDGAIERLGLRDVVQALGWTSLDELRGVYSRSHAAIVPTRSAFAEGLAMTAAEAILAGRPLITNPVVPALELLAPAALSAITNDVVSHADAVLKLATDEELYQRLCAACENLQTPFYDRTQGLRQALHNALKTRYAVS